MSFLPSSSSCYHSNKNRSSGFSVVFCFWTVITWQQWHVIITDIKIIGPFGPFLTFVNGSMMKLIVAAEGYFYCWLVVKVAADLGWFSGLSSGPSRPDASNFNKIVELIQRSGWWISLSNSLSNWCLNNRLKVEGKFSPIDLIGAFVGSNQPTNQQTNREARDQQFIASHR